MVWDCQGYPSIPIQPVSQLNSMIACITPETGECRKPEHLVNGDVVEFVNVAVLTLQALFAAPALAEQETDFSGMSFFGECRHFTEMSVF